MAGLDKLTGASGRQSAGNDPVVLAAAERAHKAAQARSISTIASGEVPMPRPDPRPWKGALWPQPPVPYDGYKPKPLTKKQQEWLAVGLPPHPSASDED